VRMSLRAVVPAVLAVFALSAAAPAQWSARQLLGQHAPLLDWHAEQAEAVGAGRSSEALLGPNGRLAIVVNPLLIGEPDARSVPPWVFERPGGEPLDDEVASILGDRSSPRYPSNLHQWLRGYLDSAFSTLLDDRVDVHDDLAACLDERARGLGHAVVLAADAQLERGESGLLLHLELRLLRLSFPGFAASDSAVSAVELLWADRHSAAGELPAALGRAGNDDVAAVQDALEQACLAALSGGLLPNLWGEPDLLEAPWFRQRDDVLGESVRDTVSRDETEETP